MTSSPLRSGSLSSGRLRSGRLRSEKLDLQLTPGAEQTLQRAAAAAQRSVTDVVLESDLASAVETLADRQSFQLDGSGGRRLWRPSMPQPRCIRDWRGCFRSPAWCTRA